MAAISLQFVVAPNSGGYRRPGLERTERILQQATALAEQAGFVRRNHPTRALAASSRLDKRL
jgi:hypothetical protein